MIERFLRWLLSFYERRNMGRYECAPLEVTPSIVLRVHYHTFAKP